MPRPKVKICGVTRIEDIELALSLGADFIGVNVYERSPRSVRIDDVAALLEAIPVGKRVLVDVATPTDLLAEYLELPFDYYQIHFDLDIAIATVAGWSGLVGSERLWLAPRIPPKELHFPQIIMEFSETMLVDAYAKGQYGGTGHTGNWQAYLDWSALYQHKHWILAGGLNPTNVGEAISVCQPEVVDLASGVESAPGIKDHKLLEDLFAEINRVSGDLDPETAE